MRKVLTIVAVLFVTWGLKAQQDPMFTMYMFNNLTNNPAYAGSKGHMSVGLLHRTQWWGIDGAPTTQSFTIHTPLKMERLGLGLSVVNDQVGPVSSQFVNMAYSYKIPFGKKRDRFVAFGLSANVLHTRGDLGKLDTKDPGDEAWANFNDSKWFPNFGAGIHIYKDTDLKNGGFNWFVGASSPHLLEHEFRQVEGTNPGAIAKWYRHYYINAGLAIPLPTPQLVFRPVILIKNVGVDKMADNNVAYQNINAPTELDIDLSFFIYNALWVGASFRTAIEAFDDRSSFDSADLWAAYYMRKGLRIGAAYDYTVTELQGPAQGSFEVFLGYEFAYSKSRIVTPRYF